ncbi:putative (E)-beta-ocimene synthase [Helianthus annuus]|uniref:(E)-beta-ocimene synthase n=2 Tax=Helianthus annuus TaxID=4232 RepID=A0A9K3I6E1_HELAN|nr:(E)-beta-ocimene synthase, chloroplastic-like [Helianthus annuus]KAF5790905.1 putative (E)-beta-ocimene synthase [Helianthus annuus]KAJ0526062.1 putative (E)-beta-ocimene synthase [Helianthus annuus]KAJ0707499.1 putative (E)-beta-ocimene synthase [Helianthus annuus]
MALQLSYQLSFSRSFFEACKPKRNIQHILEAKIRQNHLIRCGDKSKVYQADSRLAIYQPTIWSHDLIQGLDNNFPVNFEERARELEKKVVHDYLNNGCFRTLELLEHIDDIERLGLGYRFQSHIQRLLDVITSLYEINDEHDEKEKSLHEASLKFRILRQHGYNVSQAFLRKFKDSHHGFIKYLHTDIKGLLSLYEASHLAFMEESDLHEAKLFATKHLLKLKGQVNDAQALEQINHALETPLYHTMLRLQARCYIYAYNKRKDANLHLLELATLDFNRIQAAYKTELKEVSKWWKNIGLAQELSFVRDRLMECFFWTVGVVYEPQYHSCRVGLTKVCALITVIDDIYDVYGSLDELVIFTDVVKRWDVRSMEHMPRYLQIGFEALFDTITEIGSHEDITPILVKVWGELLEAFLVEAKWAHAKYIPKLEDYLDNAWLSVSGVVILTHGYFLTNQEIKKDVVESLERYGDLMKWSSMIFRLYNDLATSTNEIERGENVNAISCYMHENGVCEEVARAYIKTLIVESWRRLIKVYVACSQDLANPFIDMSINLARISCSTYQYGDGIGAPDARAKDRVFSVIIEPITIRVKEHKYT